jgi:DNA repair protein RecO (recombination protein O)
MKTHRTQAIVLRRTNYGEADRILQLLTPEGRRSVMARGVRREKSKLAGGIELFAISDVLLGEGKGELGILTSARLVHFYNHII